MIFANRGWHCCTAAFPSLHLKMPVYEKAFYLLGRKQTNHSYCRFFFEKKIFCAKYRTNFKMDCVVISALKERVCMPYEGIWEVTCF